MNAAVPFAVGWLDDAAENTLALELEEFASIAETWKFPI